jgi:hypothetical protein
MKNPNLFAAAFALLAIGVVMAFYEWKRIGDGRPIMGKSQAIVLYWCGYMTLFVLGVTTAFAAIIR